MNQDNDGASTSPTREKKNEVTNDKPPSADRATPQGSSRRRRVIEAREVFGEASEVTLLHRGEEYVLRITQNGRLILTK